MMVKILASITNKVFLNDFLSELGEVYDMLIHVFDIDHVAAMLATSDIPAAVGLMEIDFVNRKILEAVCALLELLVFLLHFEK